MRPELGVLTAEHGFECVVCALVLRYKLWCLLSIDVLEDSLSDPSVQISVIIRNN